MRSVFGILCAALALGAAPRFAHGAGDPVRICTQMPRPDGRGAMPKASLWPNGTVLRVWLMGGSTRVRERVQHYALAWNDYSGVTFQFVAEGPAEIRVSFIPNNSSWSYVGTDCLNVHAPKPTMNYGWLTDQTDDEEFSRVVLHEFGHALGFIHEHQNPAAGIPWDRPKVYAYYQATQHWTVGEVDTNLFQLYEASLTQFTAFDRDSIMLYAIPASLTLNGYAVGWNRVLSPTDKAFVATIYPPGAAASVVAPSPAPARVGTADLTGLEVVARPADTRPELGSLRNPGALAAPRPTVAPPARAAAPAASHPPAGDERMGKIENRIRNNPVVRQARLLRSDPRIKALPKEVFADLLNEYGNLMFATAVPSHDSLIAESRGLDQEQMDYADRTNKYEEDVVAFNAESAVLDVHIEQHNKGVADYTRDLGDYDSARARYEPALADFDRRLTTHNADAAKHNAEAANYASDCLGGPLEPGPFARCSAWHQSLEARGAVINARKARLDAERATLQEIWSGLEASRTSLASRSADLEARKAELDLRFTAREQRRTGLLAEQKHLEDWKALMDPKWEFALRRVDAWIALVEKFNARLEKALAAVTVPADKTHWAGAWSEADRTVVTHALVSIKDPDLHAWITTRAQFNRFKSDTVNPVTASGGTLRFKDDFFSGQTSPALQENLVAFEAGKVFWNVMKDQPLSGGGTLESWFVGYAGGHTSAIAAMRTAPHEKVSLAHLGDAIDGPSQFAHLFRAQALALEPPADAAARRQWDATIGEFRAQVQDVLKRAP